MNEQQIAKMKHAMKNQNRFYTSANDEDWNDLVEKEMAVKTPGWEEDRAYFRLNSAGKKAIKPYMTGAVK